MAIRARATKKRCEAGLAQRYSSGFVILSRPSHGVSLGAVQAGFIGISDHGTEDPYRLILIHNRQFGGNLGGNLPVLGGKLTS